MPGELEQPTKRPETDDRTETAPSTERARPTSTDEIRPEKMLHVAPAGDAWGIRVGEGAVERVFRTREDAFRNARAWATLEGRWVIVHGDGDPLELDLPD